MTWRRILTLTFVLTCKVAYSAQRYAITTRNVIMSNVTLATCPGCKEQQENAISLSQTWRRNGSNYTRIVAKHVEACERLMHRHRHPCTHRQSTQVSCHFTSTLHFVPNTALLVARCYYCSTYLVNLQLGRWGWVEDVSRIKGDLACIHLISMQFELLQLRHRTQHVPEGHVWLLLQ